MHVIAHLLCFLALGGVGQSTIQEPVAMEQKWFLEGWSGLSLGVPESSLKLDGFDKVEEVTVAHHVPVTVYTCPLVQNTGHFQVKGTLKLSFSRGRLARVETTYEDMDRDFSDPLVSSFYAQGLINAMISKYPQSRGTVDAESRKAEIVVVDSASNSLSLHWDGPQVTIALFTGEL